MELGYFLSPRPSEVEPTVLSQCNSWMVLRRLLTNPTEITFAAFFQTRQWKD